MANKGYEKTQVNAVIIYVIGIRTKTKLNGRQTIRITVCLVASIPTTT